MRFQEARSGRVGCKLKLVPGAILMHFGVELLDVSGELGEIDAQRDQESLECCFMGLKFRAISIPGCAWTRGTMTARVAILGC